MRNTLERIRGIVEGLTKEEITNQIRGLEETLIAENAIIEYSLDNDIELGIYISKTNVLSDTIEKFRIAAYEEGKLEDKLYA